MRAQRLRPGEAEVGEPPGLAAAARQTQPQLGEAEQPRQSRADDVDRLDLGERHAIGGAAQQAALHVQDAALQSPARDEPGDETEEEQQHEDAAVDERALRV